MKRAAKHRVYADRNSLSCVLVETLGTQRMSADEPHEESWLTCKTYLFSWKASASTTNIDIANLLETSSGAKLLKLMVVARLCGRYCTRWLICGRISRNMLLRAFLTRVHKSLHIIYCNEVSQISHYNLNTNVITIIAYIVDFYIKIKINLLKLK